MAYIEPKLLKQPTKEELIALSEQVHKETVAFLKKMRELDELSKIPSKNPIYFAEVA